MNPHGSDECRAIAEAGTILRVLVPDRVKVDSWLVDVHRRFWSTTVR